MKPVCRLLLPVLFLACRLNTIAQVAPRLNSFINAFDNIRKQLPIEKLYLQTDKPNYLLGDTIWLKAYLLDADYLTPSKRSGLLYVELDDNNNTCVKRVLLPVASGISWGQIALDEQEIPQGSYTLRAYTNWMRNFGEDYVFNQSIYIASAGSRSRLVVAGFKQIGYNIKADILLTDADSKPLRLQDMQLKGLNSKQTLFKEKMATGVDGRLDINFNIPEKTLAKNLAIQAKEITKGEETNGLIIPVTINRPENTDLQFMPEGGYLVQGINTKVGFKAIGEDGRGAQVSGKILNSRQQTVATFTSPPNGIGSFDLAPRGGETYTAALSFPNGLIKSYALPAVKPSGTSLRVSRVGIDSVEVRVTAKTATPSNYYLVAHARGVVCYAAHLDIKNGVSTAVMAQSLFPTGIVHFTVLDETSQPLNERLFFINHHDDLQVSITPALQTYAPHDSIALRLQVTDRSGKPVYGSFSMAVTDDNQVKADSAGGNILNSFLLTADLKGTVEEPGRYFAGQAPEKEAALDNLLLTQGWIGYSWQTLFNPPTKPAYAAEPEFTITGKVTNAFNKPLAGANIIMLSKKPALVTESTTGADGRFAIGGILPVDTAAFVIQARRKSGASFNIGVAVDEFSPPVFTQLSQQAVPWYVNSDTLLLRNRESKVSQRMAEEKLQGAGTILKEVTIKDKRVIKDSKNLNGPGGADFVLDEKEMEKAGKASLYTLLEKKFPGFHKDIKPGIPPISIDTPFYLLKNHEVNLVIDGVFIKTLGLLVDLYMNYLTAEDIKGIEIMYNPKYASAYDPDFVLKETRFKEKDVPIYLEITTYSGHGAFMKTVPGMYIYKPLPFTLPKQFYRPKYTAKNTITGTDQRSTIHWEPNIVTDTAGKATVTFYSADKPGSYTIIVEGSDLNGQLGMTRKRILIHTKTNL